MPPLPVPQAETRTSRSVLQPPPADWASATRASPSRTAAASPTSSPASAGSETGSETGTERQWRERAQAAERRIGALEDALVSRPGIEQAKGTLMVVFGIEADTAFETLVWVSQQANVKLVKIAEQFITQAPAIDFNDPGTGERITQLLAHLAR